MMPIRRFIVLCIAIGLGVPAGAVQLWPHGGDQLTLTIDHPAAVRASLDHIAFAQPQGKCGEELADTLVADFATSGKLVIDRSHFKSLIAEHKVNVSGFVDSKSAAKIGKLIGTGSLVFVKVHDCKTYHVREPNHTVDLKGNISKEEVPTTRGALKASIQIVDLTTGLMRAARVIDAKVAVQMTTGSSMKERFLSAAAILRHSESKDEDDYPPDDQAFSALYIEAVKQVHRAMLPWSETKKVTFYDDRECGLNAAYALLQAADYEGAAREALASVEKCESTPSVKPAEMARVHFNHAMTLYLLDDYNAAMTEFGAAARLDGSNKAFQPAMQECSRAWAAAQSSGIVPKKTAGTPSSKTASAKPRRDSKVSSASVEDRLRKLDELHKKKLITDNEYAQKRKAILDEM